MTNIATHRQAIVEDTLPWWRYGYVWLLISGPAVVVVAGFITLWIAASQPDPVVAEDYYQRGLDINKALESGEVEGLDGRMLPAVKGRNHAATPAPSQKN